MPQRTIASTSRTSAGDAAIALDADVFKAIDASIDRRLPQLIEFRRKLHAAPEASGEERQTTAAVAELLKAAGLPPRVMRGGVGVVAEFPLGDERSASTIALRAELDCVRVGDEKRVPYASKHAGLCHACGHDAHTAIVFGAFSALHEIRPLLRDAGLAHPRLRAIFQPAEENATGAASMIEQGAIEDVAAILAVHVEPFLDCGSIGLREGPLTSACKSFCARIQGRSGHSARPFEAVDPIPAAANLVSLFYQLCPRSMDSRYPLALTVASISAGESFNAIPDRAVVNGTLRAARLTDLEAVEQRMQSVARGVAEATGCEIVLDFPLFAPPTDNDPRIVRAMAAAATSLLGQAALRWIDVPSLGAEDFAFYQQQIPGAIVRLGAGPAETKQRRPLHSSLFDIDERAIAVGAKFLARSALLTAVG